MEHKTKTEIISKVNKWIAERIELVSLDEGDVVDIMPTRPERLIVKFKSGKYYKIDFIKNTEDK